MHVVQESCRFELQANGALYESGVDDKSTFEKARPLIHVCSENLNPWFKVLLISRRVVEKKYQERSSASVRYLCVTCAL